MIKGPALGIFLVAMFISISLAAHAELPPSSDELRAPGNSAPSHPVPGTGPIESVKATTISALSRSPAVSGNYSVEGYVVWKSECSPCPPNAVCAPCLPPSIVISEQNKKSESYSGKELTIEVLDYASFVVGKRYSLTIHRMVLNSNGSLFVQNRLIEGGAKKLN